LGVKNEMPKLYVWLIFSIFSHLLVIFLAPIDSSNKNPIENSRKIMSLKLSSKAINSSTIESAVSIASELLSSNTNVRLSKEKSSSVIVQQVTMLMRQDDRPKDMNNYALPKTFAIDNKLAKGGVSANGAVVMNGELLKDLNGRARTHYKSLAKDYSSGSFTEGAWSEFINIANNCFKVVSANPWEPFSRDQWLSVPCPPR
jgi:hypothetical protein